MNTKGLKWEGDSMFKRFYPDTIQESTYDIDFKALQQQGIKGVLFDIDNTLVEHGADATPRAIALFDELKKMGMKSCLISNNKEERVLRFNKEIGTKYIYDAHKPFGKNYKKAMELMGTDLSNTIFVGDQLFTDVFGAKRIGMRNILVRPIDPKEEIQIVLKRYLENVVLYFYRRKGKRSEK